MMQLTNVRKTWQPFVSNKEPFQAIERAFGFGFGGTAAHNCIAAYSKVDHGDGKFLGTMECQWFSSRYHCGQWFFNGFFTSEPSLSMVFHISTIGINGFSNGFSISDDGFSMVFYR